MRLLIFMFIQIFIIGCTSEPISTLLPDVTSTNTFLPATATRYPIEGTITPTTTVIQTQTIDVILTPTKIPSCIKIFYEEYAQVEIFSPQEHRVMVDVYDPDMLSEQPSEEDILLTTHTHWDHINTNFQESFPGPQLLTQAGTIEEGDTNIQGIPSAHNVGDMLIPEGGTNYIYLIETGGIRIVHFGDIGQEALTPEQIDSLGEVDVAITQLANPYSDMNGENQKGINLMEQLNPRLIIPTHVNLDSVKLAVERWEGIYSDNPFIELCASYLVDQTQILFLGQSAAQFAEQLNLTRVDW